MARIVEEDDFKQIIILGSGFDTRPQNYRFDKVRYFEVDLQNVLSLKRKIYKKECIDLNVQYILIDYIEEDLISSLKEFGVSFKEKTLFIWEGNYMYLSTQKIDNLWNKIIIILINTLL